MMNKHIFYYLMVGSMALLLGACNDSMNDLLEPKVYFESKEYNFSVEDEMDVMTFDLVSRLSSATSSQVDVSYSVKVLKDNDVVEHIFFIMSGLGAETVHMRHIIISHAGA